MVAKAKSSVAMRPALAAGLLGLGRNGLIVMVALGVVGLAAIGLIVAVIAGA